MCGNQHDTSNPSVSDTVAYTGKKIQYLEINMHLIIEIFFNFENFELPSTNCFQDRNELCVGFLDF